ncbi:MAG TPA: hypothetical protein VK116_05675, partial [Planctomycetota bacterium]|nr:hypothetical protein [Planctomycetota bacterium]
ALRVLEVGILLDELPRFEIRRRERDEEIPVGVAFADAPLEEELAPRTVRPDDILKLVPKGGSGAPAGELLGGRLLFRGTARDEAHIRAELERLARRRFEVIQTDLTLATLSSAERNALDTESGTVPAEALPPAEGEGVTFVRFLGVPGSPAILAAVDARSFVGGVDFVSGGTGFALVNLGDPETRCLGGGLVASVRVDPIPTTETFQVELFGDIARPPRFERRTRVRENQEIEPPREGQVGVIPRGSSIEIDLPDEDGDRLDHVATLPGGEARVLKTFVDALKPGNARVLIGSTRSVEIPAEEVEAEEP